MEKCISESWDMFEFHKLPYLSIPVSGLAALAYVGNLSEFSQIQYLLYCNLLVKYGVNLE